LRFGGAARPGSKLCAQIREFDTKTPVLFYSGAAYDTDKEKARNAGAQAYLVKPVENEELVAEVTRLIAESTIEKITRVV
jgi:DNA-binding response OmpR family regulator